jgi:hypothetical protein
MSLRLLSTIGRSRSASWRNCVRFMRTAICAAWLALVCHSELQFAAAAEIGADSGAAAIQYRRIYVPADHAEAWPRNKEKLIPIEAKDFDSWIRAANDANEPNSNVAIESADYTGRLDSDGRFDGAGRWTIVLRGDKPAFLPFGNSSLIFSDLHWQGSSESVRLGFWGQSGSQADRFGMEAPHAGVVTFQWHIPTHSVDHQVDVSWLVPPAKSIHFVLDLPDGKRPHIDGAVVLGSNQRPADKLHSKSFTRWEMALGPSHGSKLQILDSIRKVAPSGANVAIHDDVHYRIDARGLEMDAVWQIDGPIDQKRQFSMAVPSGLQVSSIKADGRDLSWRISRDNSSASGTLSIDIPEGGSLKPQELTISAWQPPVFDEPWRLPRLRAEGLAWGSGKFKLEVATGCELLRLSPTDCIQIGVNRINAAGNAPETHSFAAYSPSAGLEITLSQRKLEATIRAGSTLSFTDSEINGRLITQWNLARGATHRLTGALAPGWVIEAVETIPADLMAEWFLDRRGNDRRIVVQLSRAASDARNASVVITGRLQRLGPGERITAETLRMVDWSDARADIHLLSVQSSEPYKIEPVGHLTEVARDAVDKNDFALLEKSDDNKIFNLAQADKNSGMQLTLRRAEYTAEINVEITCADDIRLDDYNLIAKPIDRPIDRVLVYSSAHLHEDVRWINTTTNVPLMAERLATSASHAGTLPREGERWLLRLPQPTSQPVQISLSTSKKQLEHASVPLLALPEATQQQGHILIRSRAQNELWLEPVRLQVSPVPADSTNRLDSGHVPPVRAAYRYLPAECLDAARAPELWTTPTANSYVKQLIARHVVAESFFRPDGSGTHCLTYELSPFGATELKLSMPGDAQLMAASLNGRSIELTPQSGHDQSVSISLPAQLKTAKLSLYLETRGPPLNSIHELQPPLFPAGLPYLAGDWTFWIPEEFSAIGKQISSTGTEFNWRRRLFGLLARPAGARPFNPLLVNDSTRADEHDNSIEKSAPSQTSLRAVALNPGDSDRGAPAAVRNILAPGWRRYDESFIADGPAQVIVMHPPTIKAWIVVLFLASLLFGGWLRRRTEYYIAALALAAAVALLLPLAYAELVSGCVVGLLLVPFGGWLRSSFATDESAYRGAVKSTVAVGLAIVVAIGIARLSRAQSSKAEPQGNESSPAAIHRVLIPTDERGRPAGSKYYVSEQFLRTLMDAGNAAPDSRRQWLVRDAEFSGELRELPGRTDLLSGNWQLNFDIETLARDTTVVLPLVRGEADWNKTAMLDGVPLPLKWANNGRGCEIRIAEPGRYSLALACLPKTRVAAGRNEIGVSIPPISGARVALRIPQGSAGVVLPHSSLPGPSAAGAKVLKGELDGTDRLLVQWPPSDKQNAGKSGTSLTEMRWLDVDRAKTELQIKYILEGGANEPESLSIAYDDRWELLSKDRTISKRTSNAASQHVIQVPIAAQSGKSEKLLRWRLRGPLGLGSFRLPPIELMSNSATKRWLAVSTDSSLECDIPDSSATEGTSNDFFAQWGSSDTDTAPQFILSNWDSEHAWGLTIRPHETESLVDESLNVAAGLNSLRVLYEAKIVPGNFGAYRFELAAPANVSLDAVTLTESDQPIPVRWSRSSKNRINVFFGREISKACRLVATGTVPIDSNGNVDVPHLSSAATETGSENVRVYRDDNVRVSVPGTSSAPQASADPIEPPPKQWQARPVAALYIDSASPAAARLNVRPTTWKASGESLTALTRESGAWWATYRCQLDVLEGDLDVLQIRVPRTWSGPFEVKSSIPATTQLAPVDEQSAILSVRFMTAAASRTTIDLKLRSTLKPTNGSAVAGPNIVPLSIIERHRYLSLPDLADSTPLNWTLSGVRSANVPSKLSTGFVSSVPAHLYEITGDAFQVAQQPTPGLVASPQIRLADTIVVSSETGAQLIESRFVLSPHGVNECTLQLPAGQELVAVTLDALPALSRRLDDSHWQMALHSSQLPQSIEILSRSMTESVVDGPIEVHRPALFIGGRPIPVELSLWSFAHMSKSLDRFVSGANEVSAIEQAALRFDRLVNIADAAKGTAAELPASDAWNWFLPWAKLLSETRERARQLVVPAASSSETQVSRTTEEQINQAAQQLDQWLADGQKEFGDAMSKDSTTSPAGSKSFLRSFFSSTANGQCSYYVAEGANDLLRLRFRPLESTAAQGRIMGLLLIGGLSAFMIWLFRKPQTSDFFWRWPHTVGILVGIAYWAWLWPSWFGLLIAAASVWLLLRFNWPGRPLRTEGSTVIRGYRSN